MSEDSSQEPKWSQPFVGAAGRNPRPPSTLAKPSPPPPPPSPKK